MVHKFRLNHQHLLSLSTEERAYRTSHTLRFLENQIRQAFGFEGTPIHLIAT